VTIFLVTWLTGEMMHFSSVCIIKVVKLLPNIALTRLECSKDIAQH